MQSENVDFEESVPTSTSPTSEIITRSLTPEISYPYPLYKTEEDLKKFQMMKPNQVSRNSPLNRTTY